MTSVTGLPTLHDFDERLRLMNMPIVGHPAEVHVMRFGSCTDFRIQFGPVRTSFYQVVIHTRSQFSIRLNTFTRHATQNMLMFGTQGFTSCFQNTAPIEGYAVWFKPDFLSCGIDNSRFRVTYPFFQAGRLPFLALTDPQVADLVDLFERMAYEYQSDNPYRHEVIRSYLTILLLRIKLSYEQTVLTAPSLPPTRAVQLTRDFQTLLTQRVRFDRSVSSYADQLCVTPKHLSEQLRRTSGQSAHQLIAEQLLLEAKTLLLQTDQTITEIAFELGFHDAAHFFKFFRHLTRQSPTAYRQVP